MEIQSNDLKKNIIEATRINPSADTIPSTLSKVVVPVVNVTPNHNRIIDTIYKGASTSSGAVTIVTTNASYDFYVDSVLLSVCKDATCDMASGAVEIACVINGASLSLNRIGILTLTAQNQTAVLNFPIPIKIDRGTQITLSGTYTAGTMVRAYIVFGHTVSNF